MDEPVLQFHQVSRSFPAGDGAVRAVLRGVTFSLPAGRSVAVVGRSGSGKTTLLNLAAGLDVPDAGRVVLAGRDLASLSERARTLRRRRDVGFVFQFFHLLPHLTVLENVLLPAWVAGDPHAAAAARAAELLAAVELADRRHDPAARLSGGEQQRVAICRALLRRPRLLLADEPTGSLDDATGRRVLELLLALARGEGSAVLLATHSREVAAAADSVRALRDGVLEEP